MTIQASICNILIGGTLRVTATGKTLPSVLVPIQSVEIDGDVIRIKGSRPTIVPFESSASKVAIFTNNHDFVAWVTLSNNINMSPGDTLSVDIALDIHALKYNEFFTKINPSGIVPKCHDEIDQKLSLENYML